MNGGIGGSIIPNGGDAGPAAVDAKNLGIVFTYQKDKYQSLLDGCDG